MGDTRRVFIIVLVKFAKSQMDVMKGFYDLIGICLAAYSATAIDRRAQAPWYGHDAAYSGNATRALVLLARKPLCHRSILPVLELSV